MADPLSISTGCLAVIEIIGSTVLNIRRFLRECREAEADLRGIHDELTKLETIFMRLRDEMSGPDSRVISSHMRDGILSGIGDCKGAVSLINSVVSKHHGHPYKWAGAGKSQVAGLQSSLERYRNVLQLAVSTTQLSLLISVKSDTETARSDIVGLREDVRQLLAEFSKRRARDSDCESIITVEAEKIFEGPSFGNFDFNQLRLSDNDSSKHPVDEGESGEHDTNDEFWEHNNHDGGGYSHSLERYEGQKSNRRGNSEYDEDGIAESDVELPRPNIEEGLPQVKILYPTCSRPLTINPQCVAITPDGNAVAMSSRQSITVWDLTKTGSASAPLGSQILFDADNRLLNKHVPKCMALIRDENDNIIVAASSSITEIPAFGKAVSSSKLLVHNWTTRTDIFSKTLPGSSVDITLTPSARNTSKLVLWSLSSKRVNCTSLEPRGGKQIAIREQPVPFVLGDLKPQENLTRISRNGDRILTFTMDMIYLISRSTGETLAEERLPRGSTAVAGLPVEGKAETVIVLWHEDEKEFRLYRWYTQSQTGAQFCPTAVGRQPDVYAGCAWQRYVISPDGRLLAVCTSKLGIAIVRINDGVLLAQLRLRSKFPSDMGTKVGSIPISKPNCRGSLMAWSRGRRLVAATVQGVEVFDVDVDV